MIANVIPLIVLSVRMRCRTQGSRGGKFILGFCIFRVSRRSAGKMLFTCATFLGMVSPIACDVKGLFIVFCFLLLLVTCVTLLLCLPCGGRCAVTVCLPLRCCFARCCAASSDFPNCGQLDWSVALHTLICYAYIYLVVGG